MAIFKDLTQPESDSSLLAQLPSETQERLREIGADHRTEFGKRRDVQQAFDRHIDFFDGLISRGADHKIIGKLLAEVGIARADGTPLPIGTISSALSRARKLGRMTSDRQETAGARRDRQETAGAPRTTPNPTAPAGARPHRNARSTPAQVLRREDAKSVAPDAADVLNRIRHGFASGGDHG
jgi:hypothetical protein